MAQKANIDKFSSETLILNFEMNYVLFQVEKRGGDEAKYLQFVHLYFFFYLEPVCWITLDNIGTTANASLPLIVASAESRKDVFLHYFFVFYQL